MYDLPTSVCVNGEEYQVRSDYRVALDIFEVLSDQGLTGEQKALAALDIFYPDFLNIPANDMQEAANKMLWFLNCGDEGDNRKRPKLMDWEQDFQYIVAPINRVVGQDVRGIQYLHWWSFISAYYEIGDCFFAHIVRVRSLKAKGKQLDKTDREFYRENKRLVDIKTKYTDAEDALLSEWV